MGWTLVFGWIYGLGQNRYAPVADRVQTGDNGNNWNWVWSRQVLEIEEVQELQQLSSLIEGFSATVGRDRWKWHLDSSEHFTVASIKKSIQDHIGPNQEYVVEWNNWLPKKIGIVAWRAVKERLPTRDALAKRGIAVQSTECILCREHPETSEHLLVSCEYAQVVWQILFQWCKSQPIFAFSIKDILDSHHQFGGSKKKKKGLSCNMPSRDLESLEYEKRDHVFG
ncbi:putative reverse transcriptase zinc-binding domain-containing protein [Helianthus anomalus]